MQYLAVHAEPAESGRVTQSMFDQYLSGTFPQIPPILSTGK